MDKSHWRHARSVEIGQDLAYRRKAAGLKQADVASAVDISPQQLSKYERGQSQISVVMRDEMLDFIASKSGQGGFREESEPLVSRQQLEDIVRRHKELARELDGIVAGGTAPTSKRS